MKKTINNQTLYLGDCLEVLKTFPDECINIVVTSPPYNIGLKYRTYEDKKKNYLEFIYCVLEQLKRCLKKDGSIFLNVGATNKDYMIPYNILQIINEMFVLQNNIVWIKSISISKEESFGHYKPINSNFYLNHMFEHIFHLTKDGNVQINRKAIGVHFVDKSNLKAKTITEDLRCRGNSWFIPYETIRSKSQKGDHPAIFPKKLPEMCINLHGFNEYTIVCDPFLGHGTTLTVAASYGIKGIGIEIVKEYFDYSYHQIGLTPVNSY